MTCFANALKRGHLISKGQFFIIFILQQPLLFVDWSTVNTISQENMFDCRSASTSPLSAPAPYQQSNPSLPSPLLWYPKRDVDGFKFWKTHRNHVTCPHTHTLIYQQKHIRTDLKSFPKTRESCFLEVQPTKQSGWFLGWSISLGFPILPMGKVWSTWTSCLEDHPIW